MSIPARCPHCRRSGHVLTFVRLGRVGWCCPRCIAAIAFFRLRSARQLSALLASRGVAPS